MGGQILETSLNPRCKDAVIILCTLSPSSGECWYLHVSPSRIDLMLFLNHYTRETSFFLRETLTNYIRKSRIIIKCGNAL